MNQFKYKNFYDWCVENNQTWLLEYWDYEKNGLPPKDVPSRSGKKYYFKCGNPKHPPIYKTLNNLTNIKFLPTQRYFCVGCNSVGQYFVDNYGEDFLKEKWSDKNTINPFSIYLNSSKDIWLKCLDNKEHPDYKLKAMSVRISFNCPYCAGKQVCKENSIGNRYPKILSLWSTKNIKTPYEISHGSHQKVWLKCENGIHDDYCRKLNNSVLYDFRCPICGKENQHHISGSEVWSWKGGITPEDKRIRKSVEYNEWRNAVYQKDNYICQCCGKVGIQFNAHHIKAFSKYTKLRFDVNNGITMCLDCHDSTHEGSLHNIYGTHDVTPEQLEKYINDKRKQLGIDIPFNIQDYINGKRLTLEDVNKNKVA